MSVIGIPKGQARPRISRGHVYSPKTDWDKLVYYEALRNKPKAKLEGPLSIETSFRMPKPKYMRKSTSKWHTKRPDLDNLVKAVYDCLTQAGVWRDDAQVSWGTASKVYAVDGFESGVTICIENLRG